MRHYVMWLRRNTPGLVITASEKGMIVQRSSAVQELVFESSYRGKCYKADAVFVYEFSGKKIRYLRMIYDRLSIIKQVPRSWLERMVVGIIVERAENGL